MSGVAQWIGSRAPRGRALVLWLIPLALVYGILSALRWPMLWATDHMVFDYHFGLGKRGLFGAVLRLVAPPPYHYLTLSRIGFMEFGLWLGLLGMATWRVASRDTGIAAALVLFFLSAGFSCLVDDMGYMDHVGLCLALACLVLPRGLPWLALRAALILAGVFVHEAIFLMFAPVIAFDAWAQARLAWAPRAWLAAAGTIIPAAAATLYLGNIRTACDHAAAMAYLQGKLRDFVMRDDAVETLCRDGAWNVDFLALVWRSGGPFYFISLALLVVLPSVLFNVALISRLLSGRPAAIAVAALAAASPMALVFLGADLVRFVSLMQVTSLLILVSLARRMGVPPGGTLPAWLRNPAMLAWIGAYELGSDVILTDSTAMMKFPFTPLARRLLEVMQGHQHFLVIPKF